MSLHALAGHMAAKGRGSDSMLVHMTPEEVQSLQVLALKGGGTLTINPETGLPEANFLKKMLPMIAGFALGPAGFGLMSAGMAGAAVGGITALSTGSLSRGLMAGLGAYGGASLGAGLTSAGQGAIAASDIAAQQAAGTFPTLAEGASQEAVANYANQVNALRDTALSKAGEAGLGAKLAAGAGQMASNPGMYARELMTGLAAVSPMMADEGVQTTTKRPDTGMIRNYTYDPYGQTYRSAGNYPASEYKGMAQGGIVALAAGGNYRSLTKDSSAEDVASAYKQFTAGAGGDTEANRAAALDYLGNLGVGQDTINQAYTQFQAAPTYTDYTQQNVVDYLKSNKDIDIAAEAARLNANPFLVNQAISQIGAGYLDPTATGKGSGSGQYYDAFADAGIDANELFAANQALNAAAGTDYSFDGKTGQEGLAALNKAFETAKSFKGFDPQGVDQLAKDVEWVNKMDATGSTTTDIARLTGLSIEEVAAREAAARAAIDAAKEVKDDVVDDGVVDVVDDDGVVDVVDDDGVVDVDDDGVVDVVDDDVVDDGVVDDVVEDKKIVCASGFHYDAATKSCVPNVDATQRTTTTVTEPTDLFTAAATALPVGVAGNTGAAQVGGGATVNANGTITTSPRIPGIPVGGFTGMEQVRDAYTAGGGSLGYVNKAPTTMEEFNQRFNKQTGDSLAAYDYLMGKGAYPTKSGVDQIMRPYGEATLGIPAAEGRPTQKYLFDAATRRYVENPNYRPLSYNSAGERVVGLTPTEVLTGLTPFKDGKDDAGLFDFVTQNNISEAQLAAALGISLAEARARLAAAKKAGIAATDAAANVQTGGDSYSGDSYSGDGGYDSTAVGTGEFSGMTSADMDDAGMSSYAYGGTTRMALGGLGALAGGGSASQYNLGSYSDGGRLLRGPGDGVSDSIPATIGNKQPARLADGEFVIPARIVSELGNGSTEAGARKLYAMMDRVQKARGKTTGKKRVAANTRADKYLPA